MTDDLVKQLRDPRYDGQLMMRASAADRIEQLKEALQFYEEATPDYLHSVDWEWDCGEKRYGSVARAALENKND